MLRKGHGGLYKAPTKEDMRKRKAQRRERDQIKVIDIRFQRWQHSGKQEEGKTFHKLHALGMNDDL